jgi:CRP/FNR family transcriptional regulator/CRP/FNR family cyclic AMP-dependent transcriptional regulator
MAELLANIPLFASVEPEALQVLQDRMQRRSFDRGESIFFKGDPGDTLYVIVSGEVKIVLASEEGQESILIVFKEGDFFGEMALFDAKPRSADAVTVRATTLLALRREDFEQFVREHPEVAFPIFRWLTAKLRRTTDRLEDIIFLDLPSRVAKKLVQLARSHGVRTGQGIRIDLPLSQQELAEMVGATRPRVNEQLRRLAREGLIDVDRQTITVLRPGELNRRVTGEGSKG